MSTNTHINSTVGDSEVLIETTPLTDADFFYMVDRTKDSFSFPIHRHEEFEINYVEHCFGARRIVGDSNEKVGEYDLCIIGHGIEHGWEQGTCTSENIREITIHFPTDIFGYEMLRRNQMKSIRELLDKSGRGVAFPMQSFLKTFPIIESMISTKSEFDKILDLMKILHILSIDPNGRQLSRATERSGNLPADKHDNINAITLAKNYISKNYRSTIHLNDLANIAGMAPSSFNRLFKHHTGSSITEYVIGIRIGVAARDLMCSSKSITEICYASGFNNISIFTRIFKKTKGVTPKEFREIYKRQQILI